MKQLEVFNKIGIIIKELNDQYKYIEDNPENINDLELELFVANAHFLTDHAEILSKLNQRTKAEKANEKQAEKVGTRADVISPKVEVLAAPSEAKPIAPAVEKPTEPTRPIVTTEKFFEPVVQQPKRDLKRGVELAGSTDKIDDPAPKIDLSSDVPKDSYSFIMEEPEMIRHELIVDEADDMGEDDQEEIIETAEQEEIEEVEDIIDVEEPKAPAKIEVEPIGKKEEVVKDKDEVITINQRMSAQKTGAAANIAEQAGALPVTNLKQAITLNDKLLYIKDLFNGYSLAYSEAIEILNRFNTFEEANRFLNKNYTVKNNWDSKPETADKFFALLKRRYS